MFRRTRWTSTPHLLEDAGYVYFSDGADLLRIEGASPATRVARLPEGSIAHVVVANDRVLVRHEGPTFSSSTIFSVAKGDAALQILLTHPSGNYFQLLGAHEKGVAYTMSGRDTAYGLGVIDPTTFTSTTLTMKLSDVVRVLPRMRPGGLSGLVFCERSDSWTDCRSSDLKHYDFASNSMKILGTFSGRGEIDPFSHAKVFYEGEPVLLSALAMSRPEVDVRDTLDLYFFELGKAGSLRRLSNRGK